MVSIRNVDPAKRTSSSALPFFSNPSSRQQPRSPKVGAYSKAVSLLVVLVVTTSFYLKHTSPSQGWLLKSSIAAPVTHTDLRLRRPPKLTAHHHSTRQRAGIKHRESDRNNATDECKNTVQALIKQNIRLIAIDFDKTIVDIHTGGRWKSDAEDLVPFVRDEFKCILKACLERQDEIMFVVATFSSQTQLIQDVLSQALLLSPQHNVPVFAVDLEPSMSDKQNQLKTAMQYYHAHRNDSANVVSDPVTVSLEPNHVLLIDDDTNNIRVALENGFMAVLFYPEEPRTIFASLKNLLKVKTSSHRA